METVNRRGGTIDRYLGNGGYTLSYPDINPDIADTLEAAGTARIVAIGGTDSEIGVEPSDWCSSAIYKFTVTIKRANEP